MRRERRDGNPALALLLFRHNRTGGPLATVIQAGEIVRRLKTQLRENVAVTLVDGRQGLVGLMGDQGTAFGLFPVKTCNERTLKLHISVNNPCAAHVVQVGNSINVVKLVQLRCQLQQPEQAAVMLLHVKIHYLEVGRTVMEHRCGPHLGEHDKPCVRIRFTHWIQHGYGHGNVAKHRQAHDEHVTQRFIIFRHSAQD